MSDTTAPTLAHRASEAASRIRSFIADYARLGGLDREIVYTIHVTEDEPRHIRISDLAALCDQLEALTEAGDDLYDALHTQIDHGGSVSPAVSYMAGAWRKAVA